MNGACLENSFGNQMPTLNGLDGNKPAVVLRDTDCSRVIEKNDLVKDEQLIGKVGYDDGLRYFIKNILCKC